MLDSLKRFAEALGAESTTDGGNKLEKLAARTGTAFVVPNLVQQVDRLFDPTQYDQTGMKALLQSQVPFVRRDNKPVLNVLGEAVESGPFHYWAGEQSKDAVWRMIAEKQAFVPELPKGTIIGMRKAGPENYRAMTADEYYGAVAWSGPLIRAALEERLGVIESLPADQAQEVVRKIAQVYHKAAVGRVAAGVK